MSRMLRDRVAEFFREKTPKRALALAIFISMLLVFRKLLLLLAFFVLFERILSVSAGWLCARFKLPRIYAVVIVLALTAGAISLATWLSAGRIVNLVQETKTQLPERLAEIQETPLYVQFEDLLPDSHGLVESAKHYADKAAASAAAIGHFFVMLVIGLVLAIVYFLDEAKIRVWRQTVAPMMFFGTLARWVEHTAEALTLTIQLQMIVALCNTVLTLPVLLLIGVPHVPMLMLLIFVASLVPVVGNIVSGAVLSLLAFQAKGWFGVGLFIVLTFILHKVEAYYLNPRLTARHVQLPGFVIILSLVAWEHLLGFIGLFISFPFLFVAGKIISEFKAEDLPANEVILVGPEQPPPS